MLLLIMTSVNLPVLIFFKFVYEICWISLADLDQFTSFKMFLVDKFLHAKFF